MPHSSSKHDVVPEIETLPGTEPRFHRFNLGGIDFISLSDGGMPVPGGETLNDKDLHNALKLDANPAEPGVASQVKIVPLSCLLVRSATAGKWVLIDSGFGPDPIVPFPMPTIGRLLQSISLAGVQLSDIGAVLISHLDPDHVGGLFDASGKRVFPCASYHAGAEDVQYWSQDNPDLSFSPMVEWGKRDRVKMAKRLLRDTDSHLETFRAGEEVLPGIRSIHLPGHTLGQVGYIFAGQGATLLYTGDGITSVDLSILKPDVFNPNDLDPNLAVRTRHQLLDMLSQPGWYNFSPHFPWPSAGSLTDVNGQRTWVPVA